MQVIMTYMLIDECKLHNFSVSFADRLDLKVFVTNVNVKFCELVGGSEPDRSHSARLIRIQSRRDENRCNTDTTNNNNNDDDNNNNTLYYLRTIFSPFFCFSSSFYSKVCNNKRERERKQAVGERARLVYE